MTHDFTQTFDSIFVVESLPAREMQGGTELYSSHILAHTRRKRLYTNLFSCSTQGGFMQTLEEIGDAVKKNGYSPILHLEAHGSKAGLETADGQFVDWHTLRPPLLQINHASKNSLLVCSSSCDGGYLIRAALPDMTHQPCPFWGSLGPAGKLLPHELLRGFGAFYDSLINQESGDAALEALRKAVDSNILYLAEMAFAKAFVNYVDSSLSPELRRERVDWVVAQTGADIATVDRKLADISEMESDFYALRRRYLHMDTYPDIADRFRIKFGDAFGIAER